MRSILLAADEDPYENQSQGPPHRTKVDGPRPLYWTTSVVPALDLFRKLEPMRGAQRRGKAFKGGEHQLARLLGLVPEYWTCNSVLNRKGPCHPEGCGYVANDDWARCREVRLKLLDAIKTGAIRR